MEHIIHHLKSLLQTNIEVICGDKLIRKGRLMNISTKQHYIRLSLMTQIGLKMVELPYPFAFNVTDDVEFDYRLESFVTLQDFKADTSKCSKMFNNVVYLKRTLL